MTTRDRDNSKEVEKPRDPDFIGAEIAIQRAARKARRKAMDTLGSVAVFNHGKVFWETADGDTSWRNPHRTTVFRRSWIDIEATRVANFWELPPRRMVAWRGLCLTVADQKFLCSGNTWISEEKCVRNSGSED